MPADCAMLIVGMPSSPHDADDNAVKAASFGEHDTFAGTRIGSLRTRKASGLVSVRTAKPDPTPNCGSNEATQSRIGLCSYLDKRALRAVKISLRSPNRATVEEP